MGALSPILKFKKKTSLQILRAWRGVGALDKQIDEMLQGSVFFYSPLWWRTFSVAASPTLTAIIGELKRQISDMFRLAGQLKFSISCSLT